MHDNTPTPTPAPIHSNLEQTGMKLEQPIPPTGATPEVDALLKELASGTSFNIPLRFIDFARTLERQRDEAYGDLGAAMAECDQKIIAKDEELSTLRRELEQAREWRATTIYQREVAEHERDTARAELAALKADKERLDWLESLPTSNIWIRKIEGSNEVTSHIWANHLIRGLIDHAARASAAKEGKIL